MLKTRPVIILGAGASMPYGFPSGRQMLDDARRLSAWDLSNQVPAEHREGAIALHKALMKTLEQSIDAMLETQPAEVVNAGKDLMARTLLQCERNLREQPQFYPPDDRL